MAKIPEGCILVARKILKSSIWQQKPSWWLKVWLYILIEVNHKDNALFKRGENFFTYSKIFDDCNLICEGNDMKSLDNLMRWLKSTTQITTRRTTRGFIISVCNYEYYQNLLNYKNDTENDTENDSKTKQKRQQNDTINNNDKNDNNKNKEKKLFLDFVYLTNDEYKKLTERFGEQGTKDRIEKLNDYIGSKGAKYKSHYHTILVWANRDKEKPLAVSSPQKTATSASPSLDLNKLLSERLGRIATKDMIKAVLREIPQELWWKVEKFLQKQYSAGSGDFTEAEREIIAEARKNREDFAKLAQGIGK